MQGPPHSAEENLGGQRGSSGAPVSGALGGTSTPASLCAAPPSCNALDALSLDALSAEASLVDGSSATDPPHAPTATTKTTNTYPIRMRSIESKRNANAARAQNGSHRGRR